MSTAEMLAFENVSKRYKKTRALRNLSLTVRPGERVGLLGRNGAGKSTTIRIAVGLNRPTSGTCRLLGQDPRSTSVRRRIGYCQQISSVPPFLKVSELIGLVAVLKDAPYPADLVDRLDLGHLLHRKAGGLSYGQARLVCTLLAFVGQPELVVLDEPTAALDVEYRHIIWHYVAEFCAAGGTLLLASHDFTEVAHLTQRLILLRAGRVVLDGRSSELITLSEVSAVEVPDPHLAAPRAAERVIRAPAATIVLTRQPDRVLTQTRHTPGTVCRPPTLEEVFLVMGGRADDPGR